MDAALDEPGLDGGRVDARSRRRGRADVRDARRGRDAGRARDEGRRALRRENCSIDGSVRLATLYDPDGNVLMLYQDLSKD